MTHTLEQLKAILDGGGTIQNGPTKIYKGEHIFYNIITGGVTTPVYWSAVDHLLYNPDNWQEVKKDEVGTLNVGQTEVFRFEKPFAPRMIVMDPRELEAMEKELKELRAKVDKPLCHSCREETFWGLPYCENCHNEIIGMS